MKVKITLVDIGVHQKDDKSIRKHYPWAEALDAGKALCEQHGYDTFRIQKVLKKSQK